MKSFVQGKAKQSKKKNNNFVHRMLHFHKCCFPNICVELQVVNSINSRLVEKSQCIRIRIRSYIYNILYKLCLCSGWLQVSLAEIQSSALTPNQRRLACFARRLEKQKNGFLDNVVSCQLFCARKCCHLRIGAGRNITSSQCWTILVVLEEVEHKQWKTNKKKRKKEEKKAWFGGTSFCCPLRKISQRFAKFQG